MSLVMLAMLGVTPISTALVGVIIGSAPPSCSWAVAPACCW